MNYYYSYNRFTTLCPGLPWWVGTRRINHTGFCWSRDDGVAVASAEPYASYLHFAPEDNHASTSSLRFLQAGCSSWHPTNSIKSLKANLFTRTKVLTGLKSLLLLFMWLLLLRYYYYYYYFFFFFFLAILLYCSVNWSRFLHVECPNAQPCQSQSAEDNLNLKLMSYNSDIFMHLDTVMTLIWCTLNVCNDVDCEQKDGRHVAVGSNASSTISVFHISEQQILKSRELVSC